MRNSVPCQIINCLFIIKLQELWEGTKKCLKTYLLLNWFCLYLFIIGDDNPLLFRACVIGQHINIITKISITILLMTRHDNCNCKMWHLLLKYKNNNLYIIDFFYHFTSQRSNVKYFVCISVFSTLFCVWWRKFSFICVFRESSTSFGHLKLDCHLRIAHYLT